MREVTEYHVTEDCHVIKVQRGHILDGGANMALQFTRALRRLATVPLYRSSVQGVRYATASPKTDGEAVSREAQTLL